MHRPAKSQAKRSVKGGKIRGIKIAPTQRVRGICKDCYFCCFEITLIYCLVCKIELIPQLLIMLTGSLHFEIFKQHIREQSRLFQATESHHSSQLPESEL